MLNDVHAQIFIDSYMSQIINSNSSSSKGSGSLNSEQSFLRPHAERGNKVMRRGIYSRINWKCSSRSAPSLMKGRAGEHMNQLRSERGCFAASIRLHCESLNSLFGSHFTVNSRFARFIINFRRGRVRARAHPPSRRSAGMISEYQRNKK